MFVMFILTNGHTECLSRCIQTKCEINIIFINKLNELFFWGRGKVTAAFPPGSKVLLFFCAMHTNSIKKKNC